MYSVCQGTRNSCRQLRITHVTLARRQDRCAPIPVVGTFRFSTRMLKTLLRYNSKQFSDRSPLRATSFPSSRGPVRIFWRSLADGNWSTSWAKLTQDIFDATPSDANLTDGTARHSDFPNFGRHFPVTPIGPQIPLARFVFASKSLYARNAFAKNDLTSRPGLEDRARPCSSGQCYHAL
jgi:hypothetical protein